jgi:DNA repair photolyase
MAIMEINAKSILRKHKKIESWFVSRYGMNLYRGCTHNCVYCDGRAEGYYVDGEFGADVAVKVNALEILRREFDPKRKRTPFKRGFVMVGGGVGDSYQPIEHTYQLTRKSLELLENLNFFPVHVLTKSTLVERDLDILKRINARTRVIVSFSFSSVDDALSALVEPGVPLPSERLKTLATFKQAGIACGMFLMPVIPLLTDTPAMLDRAFHKAEELGLDFLIFGEMTLKDGRQKAYFLNVLQTHYPELMAAYHTFYPGSNKWGQATSAYHHALYQTVHSIAQRHHIPLRIPPALYRDIVDENDLVVVILEHLDYLLRLAGQKSPFGYAAYVISQVKEPLSTMQRSLRTLKGVGTMTAKMISEILATGHSAYYEQLLHTYGEP